MRKIFAALGASLIMAMSSCTPTPAFADGAFINLNSIVKVDCPGGTGSGTVIAKNRVLTAYHVVYGEKEACFIGSQKVAVTSVEASTDMAILTVDTGDTPIAPISCDGFVLDHPYLAIGYAWGSSFVIHLETMTHETRQMPPGDENPARTIAFPMFSGGVSPGMSGGPVVGFDGRVTGIVNAGNERSALLRPLEQTKLCDGLRKPVITAPEPLPSEMPSTSIRGLF